MSVDEADREALDAINNGHAWKDVHEAWERRTRKTLNPHAFGRYILSFQENGVTRDRPTPQGPPSRSPDDHRPPALPPPTSNFTPLHAPPPAPSPHFSQPQAAAYDTIESQRRDLSRVERALGTLNTDVQDMRREMEAIRRELHTFNARPSSSLNQTSEADAATLDLLSDHVSNMSAKAGEVDGIKFQIEVLRRRLRKLEEGGPVGPLPPSSLQESSFTSQGVGPKLAPYVGPQTAAPGAPLGWNPANLPASKRKSTDNAPHAEGKRQRGGPSGHFGHEYGSSGPSTQTLPPVNAMTASPNSYYDPIKTAVRYFAPKKDDSKTSVRSESERDPNGGRGGLAAPRKLGRPRKTSSDDRPTSVWDKEPGSGSEVGADGNHRPNSTVSPPPSSERGRVVRRGSGGGVQDVGRDAAKRTRQRPIRNSDGVLIRKDGKPDQRSISSPMNLRKVHARKMQENEMASTSGGSPTSPLVNNDTGDENDDSMSPDPEDRDPRAHERHRKNMNRMFPNGVASDARRMNQADYHFSRPDLKEEQESDRPDPDAVIIKEEPRTSMFDSQTTAGPTLAPMIHPALRDLDPSSAACGLPPPYRETDQTTPSTGNPNDSTGNEPELVHATGGSPHQTSAASLGEAKAIQDTPLSEERAASLSEPVNSTAEQAAPSIESST